MGVESWWNDTDKGQPEYCEGNLSSCRFVHQKSPTWAGLGLKFGLCGKRPATGYLNHDTAVQNPLPDTANMNFFRINYESHHKTGYVTGKRDEEISRRTKCLFTGFQL
jgi:hypothetical protein